MDVHEVFTTRGDMLQSITLRGVGRPWDTLQSITFWVLSDRDPGILFLLQIVLLYYCSLGISTLMLTILVMSLVSILCTSLTLRSKAYSLAEV